ncbi:MAG: hypothetical protein R3Y06_00615 [Faecalibacterium sp.]
MFTGVVVRWHFVGILCFFFAFSAFLLQIAMVFDIIFSKHFVALLPRRREKYKLFDEEEM